MAHAYKIDKHNNNMTMDIIVAKDTRRGLGSRMTTIKTKLGARLGCFAKYKTNSKNPS